MKLNALAIGLLVLAGMNPGYSQTPGNFPGTIILGTPTDHSITVNVRANAALEMYFEYGVKSSVYTARTESVVSAVDPYAGGYFLSQTVINGLQGDTRYYYRIQYRSSGSSGAFTAGAENAFYTQRAPGSTFVFCTQGDSHPERANSMFNPTLYNRTLSAVAAEKPDLYVISGDDFSVDTLPTPYTSAAVAGRYTLQLPYLNILARSSALFLVNGNHEEASLSNYNLPTDASNSNQVPIWAQNARNLYYPVPAPNDPITGTFYAGNSVPVPGIGLLRNYYAWQWGDALFLVIDPYWSSPAQVDSGLGGQNSGTPKTNNKWDITHGDAQYLWLKQTLEQSKAKWKFVFAHHVLGTGRGAIEVAPYYEWGGLSNNGSQGFAANRPGWAMPIHQLLVANNVTIFFQGHDHLFAHQQLDGVTYQELPNPADNTYTAFNADAYKSGDIFPNAGYVKVTVSPSAVKVDYIREFLPQDEKPPQSVSGMVQFSYTIQAKGSSGAAMAVGAGGSAGAATQAGSGPLQAGYATATIQSGSTPYGTAVFSLTQEGVVVSETGVPTSPPTTAARLFVEYGNQVSVGPARLGAGPVDVFTGIAVVNPGTTAASVTYMLRNMQGQTLAVGHGTLAAGAHRARFLHQLRELAPDFVLPAGFATDTRYGTLEVASGQALSILGLRMTVNQRGNTLFTSVPAADLTRSVAAATLCFPQLADGDGYTTTLILLNTSAALQSGTLRFFGDEGSPLAVGIVGGTGGTTVRYSIPAGGAYLLQTDGSPAEAHVGSVQLSADTAATAPVGAGLFNRTSVGTLVTESGVAASTPTNHARVYVDLSGGRDSGLAIAAPDGASLRVTMRAYQADGLTAAGAGTATLELAGNGHRAAFVGQWITGLPTNFRGVLDIAAPTPFAALTLRALTNARQDFLITAFPIADLNRPAPAPMVFPQIADGGGYRTEFILLSSGSSAALTLSFFGDDGSPLAVGPSSSPLTVTRDR